MIVTRPLLALAGILTISACGPTTADAAANADTGIELNTTVAPDLAPAATPAQDDAPTIDRTNRTGAAVLHDIFVAAGQIDGKRITDFKLSGRCKTVFTTTDNTTTIDWSKVGNFAGRDDAGRTVLDIDDGAGSHAISVPSGTQAEPLGNAAARVDGGLSVIADSCGG
ncbi:hypothetical protein ACVWZA_003678 [Sphingomonas sp. UYAg733]